MFTNMYDGRNHSAETEKSLRYIFFCLSVHILFCVAINIALKG